MATEKRLPTKEDFDSSWTLSITPPPKNQKPTNVLLFFHGLGGSHEPFAQLGTQMNLPETACISIRGPEPLPFEPDSFHYGDDVIFDNTIGSIDPDGGFKKQSPRIRQSIIQRTLIQICAYKPREIFLFGFGQGGMLALDIAASTPTSELGGIISIGGALPSSTTPPANKIKTPVLVAHGIDSPWLAPQATDQLKRVFESVTINKYRRQGDSMPQNRDEMMPVMRFFGSRLRSTAGVPEGSIEV
ncbi:hypothetical protein AAFC00_003288 [Neodothiora populina]|uniref:Phospholipase/carboxylesterase/thioesterase domain-containing protein n=1 Tax=Neodothiora populina TaxID=2781224 RepID=A0ABR3PA67_9PEZI